MLAVMVNEPVPEANIVRLELLSAALNTFCPNCRKSFTPLSSKSLGVEYPSPSIPEVILPKESTV